MIVPADGALLKVYDFAKIPSHNHWNCQILFGGECFARAILWNAYQYGHSQGVICVKKTNPFVTKTPLEVIILAELLKVPYYE